jgi:YVTN family beta-propeller protein
MQKFILPAGFMLLLLSCSDPSGPGPVDPTPSVLTAVFRGWVPPDRGSVWAVDISWTVCPDSGFAFYDLYRSLTPEVATSPTTLHMRTITVAGDTTFTDNSGDWETTYYYAVRTTNTDAAHSWSNEDTVVVADATSYGGPDYFNREIAVGAGPVGISISSLTDETFVACYFDNQVDVLGTPSEFFSVQTSISTGSGPMDTCASSGSYIFVSNSGDNTVSVIDASGYSLVATIDVGDHPVGLCYDPVQDVILVACYETDEVWVIDASSFTVTDTVSVGDGPWDVCVSGDYAYTANRIDGTVSVIDLNFYTVLTTLGTGNETRAVCSLVDGSEVWAADYSGDRIYVINTATQSVETSFDTGNGPADMYALSNGQMIYLSCFLEDRVDMIDPLSRAVLYSLDDGIRPLGVCETVDGAYALVAGSAFSTVIVYEYDPYP